MNRLSDVLFEGRLRVLALARRFDARPQRERMAMLLAAAALLLLAGDRFWLTPSFGHFKTASQALADARRDQQALSDETEQRRVQGDAVRRSLDAEVAQWRQRTAQTAQDLAETEAGLIGADRMVALLEQMLPRGGSVHVVGLKSLAPQDARVPVPLSTGLPGNPATAPAGVTLPPPAAATAAAEGAPLYRHGVEITVEGGYADLMNYLAALEALPGPKLLWGGVKLKVERHPTVQLTLTVYTLSLDRAWLEL
jgi:MSHA biogenesis protein MshJ